MNLGVNIDHVAVLREARNVDDPDILNAMYVAREAGAHQITIHLREDRRHIQDIDVKRVVESSKLPINVECAMDEEICDYISFLKPRRVTIVPEKREELTTEGGLDLENNYDDLKSVIRKFRENDIDISLFIDPKRKNIDIAYELEADMIELHTGEYSNITLMLDSNLSRTKSLIPYLNLDRGELKEKLAFNLHELKECSILAKSKNISVAAGHGLNYENVKEIVAIKEIEELNIGQSIIARAVFVGLKQAIKDMIYLCNH